MAYHGRPLLAISALLGLPCLSSAQSGSIADQALSILKQNCASCHGASQQMSGYDLRTREAALRGGSKGAAIVPGKPDDSPLILRLTGAVQPAMPLGAKLKDSDIATLRQWITEGAKWNDTAADSG